jgi:hypothetical protein
LATEDLARTMIRSVYDVSSHEKFLSAGKTRYDERVRGSGGGSLHAKSVGEKRRKKEKVLTKQPPHDRHLKTYGLSARPDEQVCVCG